MNNGARFLFLINIAPLVNRINLYLQSHSSEIPSITWCYPVTVITLHFPINKVTRLRTFLKRGTGKLKMGTKPNLNPSRFSNFISYSLFGSHFSCFLSLCSFPIPFSPFPASGSPFPRHLFPIPCSLYPVRCSPFPVPCFRSPFHA